MRRLPAGAPAYAEAVAVLRRGGLVALPTDTFYGLAVRVDDAEALSRLTRAKGRMAAKPIPVLAADLGQAVSLSRCFPEGARRLAARWWPGALTLVVPARADLPDTLTGGTGCIGVRVANHGGVAELLDAWGAPITGTSANRSGEAAPTTAGEVEDGLGDAVDLLLDGGRARGGEPSTVLDCSAEPFRVLRAGAVPASALRTP